MGEIGSDFRRQQRRRAIVAWVTAALAVALFTLAAVLGDEKQGETVSPISFGYSMTAEEYASLEPGLAEDEFVATLEQSGLPESETKVEYVELFPAHAEDVECSFWEISDRLGRVARICFAESDARLVQKLERDASAEPTGVSA